MFTFTPKIGEDGPILTSILFRWVVQPPSSYFFGVSKDWLSMTPSNQTFPRIAGLVVAITIAEVLRFLKGGGWNLVGYMNG